ARSHSNSSGPSQLGSAGVSAGRGFEEKSFLKANVPVFDRIGGHRRDEVPTWFTDIRVDRRRVAEEIRLPLVGVTADEAIEMVKAHTCRPLVEGPGLARLEFRSVVVLAELGRPVAVILEDLSDRCLVPGHDAVVALNG